LKIITNEENYRRDIMKNHHYKEKFMAMPIENHETAAWANIEKTKPLSNVSIPDESEVFNAKEYVDENQK
jgi:hypothetical protein